MIQLRHSLQWLLSASTAAAISFTHRESPPPGWEPVANLNLKVASNPAPQVFTIALAMQNIEKLESMLLAVSTPGHAQYGKYLDHDQINAHFAPSSAAVDSVTAWLKSGNITQYTVNGSFIDFAADIPAANNLLEASYQQYSHNGVTKLRTLSYSIPDHLDEHITLITPGIYFDTMRSAVPTPSRTTPEEVVAQRASNFSVDASCQTSVTPACLKQMYNVGDYTPDPKSGSFIGFGSFLNQSALYSDLFQYEDMNKIPRQNFSVELIAGGTNNQDPSTAKFGEANMDVQIIVGVAHPLPVVEYITGGSP